MICCFRPVVHSMANGVANPVSPPCNIWCICIYNVCSILVLRGTNDLWYLLQHWLPSFTLLYSHCLTSMIHQNMQWVDFNASIVILLRILYIFLSNDLHDDFSCCYYRSTVFKTSAWICLGLTNFKPCTLYL